MTPRARKIGFGVLASAVALLQFRLIILIFGPQYRLSVEAASGVLLGEPHWRVYQSRLLGPHVTELLSRLFGSFLDAHVFLTIALLAGTGYLVLVCLERLYGDLPKAVVGYFALSLLVICCFQKPWLYIWDFVDLLIFVVFNAFVAQRRDYRYFAALFVVAIFNRESACYIAAWMILDPLIRFTIDRRREGQPRGIDLKMLGAGSLLLAGGLALVEMLRRTLLVREVGPSLVGAVEGAGERFHWMLPDNLERLMTALTSFKYSLSFLIPLFLLAYLVFCVWLAYRDPRRRLGLALVHASILLSNLAFGVVFETRIYLVLMPFVAFNLWPLLRESVTGNAAGVVDGAAANH